MDSPQIVQNLIDENEQFKAERAEFAEILRPLEWQDYVDEKGRTTGIVYCPLCGGSGEDGSKTNPPRHYKDCRIAHFIYGEGNHKNVSDELTPD